MKRLIWRALYGKSTFWGFRRIVSGGHRFGFGRGFIEWGTGIGGVYLRRKDDRRKNVKRHLSMHHNFRQVYGKRNE